MKKRWAFLIVILFNLSLPFLMIAGGWVSGLYFNYAYGDLDQQPSSKSYVMKKLPTKGYTIVHQSADELGIDTMYIDTLVHPSYYGHVYIDTVRHQIKIETNGDYIHYLTMDAKGKLIAALISKDPDRKDFSKDCLLLPDELKIFEPWLDASSPVYLTHFSKQNFDTNCLNPLRGWGSPNGTGICYFWTGMGYFRLSFNGEILKFRYKARNEAILDSFDSDYEIGLHYYKVPERFKMDIAFLKDETNIYLIRRK